MIEFEVAGADALRSEVGFFAADNFVDEESHFRISHRHPGKVHTSQVPLQTLEQRHEIPDGEDMGLEERANRSRSVHTLVDGVLEQTQAHRFRARVNKVRMSIHG